MERYLAKVLCFSSCHTHSQLKTMTGFTEHLRHVLSEFTELVLNDRKILSPGF